MYECRDMGQWFLRFHSNCQGSSSTWFIREASGEPDLNTKNRAWRVLKWEGATVTCQELTKLLDLRPYLWIFSLNRFVWGISLYRIDVCSFSTNGFVWVYHNLSRCTKRFVDFSLHDCSSFYVISCFHALMCMQIIF